MNNNKGRQLMGSSPGVWLPGLVLLLLTSVGCGVGKHLEKDQKLYHDTHIVFKEEAPIVHKKQLKYELDDLSEPKPNSRLWLWVYYNFGNPDKEGGIGNFIKRRFGQAPVFYDQAEVDRNVLALKKYLIDEGYFSSSVQFDTSQRGKNVAVTYRINTSGRHQIRNITLPGDSSNIAGIIRNVNDHSYLKSGDHYALSKLVNERNRIAVEARNRGYFDFTDDKIFYFVDTNAVKDPEQPLSDIWLQIKKPENTADYTRYYIGTTHIYPNYDLARAASIRIVDSIRYKDLVIYQNKQIINPSTLRRSITQQQGDVFSEERQIATSNHLLDLGIYKFVNLKYRVKPEGDTIFLDRYIYLTPGKVQNVGAALETTTRAGAYGISVRGTYSHNNIFGGAERLDLSVSTGFERGGKIAITDDTLNNNLKEITARADLSFPRFILPFIKINSNSTFHIPRTRMGILANYQDRPELFTLYNYRFTFGYDWDETRRKRHQLNPLSINTVRIARKSESFNNFLEQNPLLKRSFANLFIIGSTYTYTLTNQEINRPDNYFFFLGQLEASGNTAYLGSLLFHKKSSEPFTLFKKEFSQYTKLDFDFRYNWLGIRANLVTKFSGGIGLAYLNSVSLPIIKQYFAGGANSMRGFPIRGLLGSSATDGGSEIAQSSFDHTGDLKIEWNIEYRFDLLRELYLKGAVFADIGNVWKVNGRNLEPNKNKLFAADRFLSELAVAGGIGVRLDIQYLVLRLDLGLPLRKPFLDPGARWTFDRIGTRGWIRDNLVYNFALGYPF